MGARRKARKRALDVLYEADLMGADWRETLQRRIAQEQPPMPEYAVILVEGVIAQRERLDELISTHAVGWEISRMPAIDRNLLRLGAYELLFADDVPDGVALAEAVELAAELSTEESSRFVNGVLARLVGTDVSEDLPLRLGTVPVGELVRVDDAPEEDGAPAAAAEDDEPADELVQPTLE